MATFLFDNVVFGPVKSRRLGISLGINLLPTTSKLCNFNCIYCECGWNNNGTGKLPTTSDVYLLLKNKLEEMKSKGDKLDVITFAGNGEPTMHPFFSKIIDNTILLRNLFYPNAKIAVLSNSTLIHKPQIFKALQKVDQNILKLDSGIEATIQILNQPTGFFNLKTLIGNFKKFNGNLIIQTLFLKGEFNGISIDNTSETELIQWIELIKEIKPKQVMIYTIARDTPANNLMKVSLRELQKIAKLIEAIGIPVQIAE